MSIREQIASLEELASIDTSVRHIDEELEKHKGGLKTMQEEVHGLEDRLRVDRGMLTEMDKTRNDLVTELRQMGQQIERSREKLQRSRNERESNAAQRELEELRKLHRDREDEMDRLSTAADQARTSIADAEGKHKSISGELEGSQPGITSSVADLDKERAEKMALRAAVVKQIPMTIYRRYESIRTRRPMAIARTYDGTCLGCHLSVPPMMFQKMRRQEGIRAMPALSAYPLLHAAPRRRTRDRPRSGSYDWGRDWPRARPAFGQGRSYRRALNPNPERRPTTGGETTP